MRPEPVEGGRWRAPSTVAVAVWFGRVGLCASLVGLAGQLRDPQALPVALVLISLACSAFVLVRSRR